MVQTEYVCQPSASVYEQQKSSHSLERSAKQQREDFYAEDQMYEKDIASGREDHGPVDQRDS